MSGLNCFVLVCRRACTKKKNDFSHQFAFDTSYRVRGRVVALFVGSMMFRCCRATVYLLVVMLPFFMSIMAPWQSSNLLLVWPISRRRRHHAEAFYSKLLPSPAGWSLPAQAGREASSSSRARLPFPIRTISCGRGPACSKKKVGYERRDGPLIGLSLMDTMMLPDRHSKYQPSVPNGTHTSLSCLLRQNVSHQWRSCMDVQYRIAKTPCPRLVRSRS
jgi:hypothetical protein